MPVNRNDPMTMLLFALGGGADRDEQRHDPRTKAIEQYMQEHESKALGNWYAPENITPRSPHADDQGEAYNQNDYEPYRGPVELHRGRRNAR